MGKHEAVLFAAPRFEDQGMTVEAALLELGLVNEPFYDCLRGAGDDAIAALEAAVGFALPSRYREFLRLAGASLGPLQLRDWRTTWRFDPETLVATMEAKSARDRTSIRADRWLPVALLGECLLYDYYRIDDICLYMDAETGWLFTDDYDRDELIYDCVQAFLLEWGHRLLDPRLAAPAGYASTQYTSVPAGVVSALHETAGQAADCLGRHVGGLLGIYRYYDSGVIIKTSPAYPPAGGAKLRIEARCAYRVDPRRCAAAGVVRQLAAQGGLRADL